MQMTEILAVLVPSVGAAIGVWVQLNTEIAKLKSRVMVLERDRSEVKEMIRECVDGINELKLLLAKKGL